MLNRLSQYYFNKGLEHAKAGMISTAIENLDKSLRYDRSNSEAWKLLGLCFYRLGRLTSAEYCWAKCLQYSESDISVGGYIEEVRLAAATLKPHIAASFYLASQRKYKKASKVFSKNIIPILSSHADAHSYLGILYMLSGYQRKALREWKKALQIDSSNIKAVRYLAYS